MPTFTQLASDNFQRPDEDPLNPAVWTSGAGEHLAVVSHACVGELINSGGIEVYTGISFPNDQYAAITIGAFPSTGNSHAWPTVRTTPSISGAGYFAVITSAGTPGNSQWYVSLTGPTGGLASAWLVGGNPSYGPPRPGDVLLLAAIGNNIIVQYNGVTIISITDNSSVSGVPGIGVFFNSVPADTSVTLFSAGKASSSVDANDIHSVDSYVYGPKAILGGKSPINTKLGGILEVE